MDRREFLMGAGTVLTAASMVCSKVALTVFATKCIHLAREGKGSLFSEARSSKDNHGL